MARGRKPGKKDLVTQVRDLDAEFADAVPSMSVDELNKKLADMAKYDEELNQAKELDTDLARAREQLKVCNETYKTPKKAIKLKTKLIVETLQGRGRA